MANVRISTSASAALAAFAALALAAVTAQGDDFRIDSKVYLKSKPIAENLTLFHGERVYDFMSNPTEITVFDPAPGRMRFLILDPTRKLRTEVKVAEVSKLMDKLRDFAKSSTNPFMNFLADPTFEEKYDSTIGVLQMTSPWMEYKLTTLDAPNAQVSEQYSQFSDWYAKLNTMTTPGKIPPFARMVVNTALKKHKQIPSDVVLTLHLKEEVTLTSDHKVHWRLLEDDMQKIRQVDDYLARFKSVPYQEYYRAEEPAPEKQAGK
jgi:hypothetical protein